MKHLFDFGISQEDPLTEFRLLQISKEDRLLCIASGGEIPLSLCSLQPGVTITAVDTSPGQIFLCKLKLLAATTLLFPENAAFLGYSHQSPDKRRETYFDQLRKELSPEEQVFWDKHVPAVEKGVINSGRFEQYIAKLRFIARFIIGRRNLEQLLQCSTLDEQATLFDNQIATRKAVRYLFKIAFHPAVYKNRGLSAKGMIHTQQKMGDIFFNKFRNFCVCTPAADNYFLHYFLAGACISEQVMPEYLVHSSRLQSVAQNITWKNTSLQAELKESRKGTYNKIHLSNIGDWMTEPEFADLFVLLNNKCVGEQKILYRYLRKNHVATQAGQTGPFTVKEVHTETTDRFPFYSMQLLEHYE